MKLNWATSIVLAFIVFIVFILYFVINASTDVKYHHDLVSINYYEEELNYQNDIEHEKRAIEEGLLPKLILNKQSLELVFPKVIEPNTTGTVVFYRPSNKNLDFKIPLKLKDSKMIVFRDQLLSGRWELKVFWQSNKKNYLFKKSLML